MRTSTSSTVIGALLGASLVVVACGNASTGSTYDGNGNGNGSATPYGGDGGAPSFATGDAGSSETKECVNLCTRQVTCSGSATTSVSGTVFDPAGRVPLYNVIVYVPNAPLAPMQSGATCEKCGTPSGDPLVATLTDAAGHFRLDNVPAGSAIPLVMQVGKWRRQITLPFDVKGCVDNPVADTNLTRLPKNQREGDIPKIALTTGGADALECLLRKVGIDDAEFTAGGGSGRVQLFAGSGDTPGEVTSRFDGAHGGQAFGDATQLWSSESSLAAYDLVLLSCEGNPHPETKSQQALDALFAYANAGGRVFASHWHRYWFDAQPAPQNQSTPFANVGIWNDRNDPQDPADGTVDVSFPKGQAMHDWLGNTGALTGDRLPIQGARHNVDSVVAGAAQSWITLSNDNENGQTAVEYLSFNTPQSAAEDQKCGRVVYSDLHVSSGVGDSPGPAWPGGCTSQELSPQEKALEFMLFDLSSCIQSDSAPPKPPAVK